MRDSEILKVNPSELLEATKQELRETKRELRSACDAVYGLSSELGELRIQLSFVKDKIQLANDRNRLILNSFTWKLGYLLMTPWRLSLWVFKHLRRVIKN